MIATECPTCRHPIPADAPAGLCPKCLVDQALGNDLGNSILAETTGIFPISADVPTAAEVDRLVPDLDVLELIGHGGMGVVYLARQPNLDRKVALKLLSPRFVADPTFAERFGREARSLARLSHPNVVGIHDSGRVGDHYYLVMEYVEGTSLRELMGAEPLTPTQAIDVTRQVCQALQFAHTSGVVHRDVKPENVLVGEDGRVRLADFGLAKLVDAPLNEASLTLTKQVMGTPHYMAPEAVRSGSSEADPRGDVYAVGVMLYESLTGRLPLGRFQAPSELGFGDSRLDRVVLRALEADPAMRFSSAGDMDRSLEALAAEEPVHPANFAFQAPEEPAIAAALPTLTVDPPRPLAERLARWSCAAAAIAVVLAPLAGLVKSEAGPGTGFGAKVLGLSALLSLVLGAVLGRVALWQGRRGWPLSGLPRFQALAAPALLSVLLFASLLLVGPVLAAMSVDPWEISRHGQVRAVEWEFQVRRFLGTLIFSTMLAATWLSACPDLVRKTFFPLFPSGDSTPLWMLTLTTVALFFATLFVI